MRGGPSVVSAPGGSSRSSAKFGGEAYILNEENRFSGPNKF